jgi:hypothetical protein
MWYSKEIGDSEKGLIYKDFCVQTAILLFKNIENPTDRVDATRSFMKALVHGKGD